MKRRELVESRRHGQQLRKQRSSVLTPFVAVLDTTNVYPWTAGGRLPCILPGDALGVARSVCSVAALDVPDGPHVAGQRSACARPAADEVAGLRRALAAFYGRPTAAARNGPLFRLLASLAVADRLSLTTAVRRAKRRLATEFARSGPTRVQ
jgi:hypothetical protein